MDILKAGEELIFQSAAMRVLRTGNPIEQELNSPSTKFRFVMQEDGNLVLYRRRAGSPRNGPSDPIWASGTVGRQGTRAVMQGDGNFVLYTTAGEPVWASNTAGNPGSILKLQDDGNLVIYSNDRAVWATATNDQRDRLRSREKLEAAEDALNSPNSKFSLVMQRDGNLVLYRNNPSAPIWASDTAGKSVTNALMNDDGNLALYNSAGEAVWSSNTAGNAGAVLKVQDDGNLVIYNAERPIWSTGSFMHPAGPSTLQFLLLGFSEEESNDSGLQGASDEVFISAQGTDSAAISAGPDGGLTLNTIDAPVIGDVSESPGMRDGWRQNPYKLLEFDLDRAGYWPRTYMVILYIVEEDNASMARTFEELKNKVGDKARAAVISAATAGGAAVGTLITPGIGTAVGAAAGFLGGVVWDALIPIIGEGLANEAYAPRILNLTVPEPDANASILGRQQSLKIEEHGARYIIDYEWRIVTR